MKFTTAALALGAVTGVLAHPERLTEKNVAREVQLMSRSSGKCAAAIEARKTKIMARQAKKLYEKRAANGQLKRHEIQARGAVQARNQLKYTTIQNDTCVLAPETVWGPYAVDGEMKRHDLRESSGGVDLYLDLGVIDVETCEPLPNAALTIWNCNATGYYSSYTGIDPDTVSIMDGWSLRSDGTTDDETFLRGIQMTDSEGMAEFLTLFPGYYASRTTHIHVTVQTDVTNGTSYSNSSTQHLGQLFFNESLINEVYQLSPYSAHLETLNRTLNSEDTLYNTATSGGYSALISVSKIGATIADGLIGYITLGVNTSAEAATTTGGSVNPQGFIPTVSVGTAKLAQATAADKAAGYTS